SALPLFALMQRHGNRSDPANRHRFFERRNRLCEYASQNCACRTNLLKLEEMHQIAQSPFIAAVSDRPLVRRIDTLTEQAPNFAAVIATLCLFRTDVARQMHRRPANGA